ncbi:hypothetical protein H0Z60_19515 [Ectothiorhodospiraceae bacterium WFHF3C12]|nr:hypothetical protein [Ectothiorhodospiraceae bacterium WFHF3C12]
MSAPRDVALLTQHGKERLLAPALEPVLGRRVRRVSGFDTDRLGTFTREIRRQGTQMEAARRKARTGMELAGAGLGLASEGAFGADPYTGLLAWNTEIVMFIDDGTGLEITGEAHGPARRSHGLVADWTGLCALAEAAGFPEHGLTLRPEHEDHPAVTKGIADWGRLRETFHALCERSAGGGVFAESDLRAHCNPTRQGVIRRAAENLAARLRSRCPACDAPGFWVTTHLPGLGCRWCGEPTHAPRAEHWACPACGHATERAVTDTAADPAHCVQCNP